LCLLRRKANADKDSVCGRQVALLQQCFAPCWKKRSLCSPVVLKVLRELGNVANFSIWSSMRVAIVKSECDLLFKVLLIKPVNILGQESCEMIKVPDTHGKVSFLQVKGTDKPMFLKVI
jgi:hypothetical protein